VEERREEEEKISHLIRKFFKLRYAALWQLPSFPFLSQFGSPCLGRRASYCAPSAKPIYELKTIVHITTIRYKLQPKSLYSKNRWTEALISVRHPMSGFEKLIVTNFFHVSELSRKPISEIALFFFIRFFFTLPPPLSPPLAQR
jgi:hypothetical protein